MGSLSERHIAQLWVRMTQLYGHRWASSYGDHDADNIWLRALQGITPLQIGAGLERLTRSGEGWPPTAPEFRAMCETASLAQHGLPDPDQAYQEAAGNAHNPTRAQWSHPAVYVAGRETGWFDLRHGEVGDRVERRFRRNYEIATRRVLAGEMLDAEIPEALEDTRGRRRALTEMDRQAGRRALNELRGLFA